MQIKRSIKYKTVLCIAITVFAVGTVTALLSYHLNKLRLKKSYIESTNSVMEVTHNYLQDKLTEIYRTSLAIYSSSVFEMLYQDQFDYRDFNTIKKVLQSYCEDPDVLQTYLWSANLKCSLLANKNATFTYQTVKPNKSIVLSEDRYAKCMPLHESDYYDYSLMKSIAYDTLVEKEDVVTLTRTLYPIHGNADEPLGVIAFDIKAELFFNAMSILCTKGADDLYIVSGGNELIADVADMPVDMKTLEEVRQKWQSVIETPEGILIFFDNITIGDMQFDIYKVAYPASIYAAAMESFYSFAGALLVALGLILLTTILIFNHLFYRIYCLRQYTLERKNGNTDTSLEKYPGLLIPDEIGVLSKTFEKSIDSVNELTEQKYKLLLDNKEMQIKMLQAQINPHFVSNALQAIGNAVFEKEPIYVYRLISNLGKMMKYSMHTDRTIVFLKEETDYLSQFLIFQAERIGVKFHFDIQVEKEVEKVQIPKMLIQPLVENCISHGYTGLSEDFYVSVDVKQETGCVLIWIKDSGIGVTEEKLEEMNNKTILAQRGRIGIVNIYKRLQLFYNDGYELNFQNLAPHGLSCFLKVPMETKDL